MPDFVDKVKSNMTKKLGPLPAWAWGVVAASGIWIARSMMGSSGDSGSGSGFGFTSTQGTTSVVPSLSGAGAPPPQPTPAYGAPDGPTAPTVPVLPTDGETSFDDDLLARARETFNTGGDGTVFPDADTVEGETFEGSLDGILGSFG